MTLRIEIRTPNERNAARDAVARDRANTKEILERFAMEMPMHYATVVMGTMVLLETAWGMDDGTL